MRYLALLLAFSATTALAHPTPSVRAVFHGPKVIHFEGNVPFDTPFAIASVGKLFTSIAMMTYVDDGLLDLDAPVSNWLPVETVDGFNGMAGITLRHLANMTSGLPDYYDLEFLAAVQVKPVADQTPAYAVSFAFDEPTLFAPGAGFDYSNTNYVLIQMVMEAAANDTYVNIIQARVLDPLNLTDSFVFGSRPLPDDFQRGHDGFWHVRDYYNGRGYGDGGVISTASDLATLYEAVLNRELLSDQSWDIMLTDEGGEDYGMGIVVGQRYLGHSGADIGFGSHVIMNVETGNIAVQLVGESDADVSWVYDAVDDFTP